MLLLALTQTLLAGIVIGPPEVEIPGLGSENLTRCEPSIAASGDNVLVSWNDSIGGKDGSPSGTAIGWAYSTDAGKTFKVGGHLRNKEGKLNGADSRIVASKGRFFLQVLAIREGIHLYEMSVKEMGKLVDLGNVIPDADLDKPAMVVEGDRIAIAYTKGTGEICVSRSNDSGRTFGKDVAVSGPEKKNRSGVSLAFDGQALRCAWMEGKDFRATEVGFASAAKWQGSFTPARSVYKLTAPPEAPKGQVMAGYRDGGYSLFSCDTGLSLAKSELQLSLVEGAKEGSRVVVLRSRDGGKTWSAPIEASALFPDGHNSYASICPLRDQTAILYYHQEARTLNGDTHVVVTSLGSDASFTATVTSQPSAWKTVVGDAKFAPIQRVFGDYISIAAGDKNDLYAAWTDGRNGRATIMIRHLTGLPSVRRVL